MNKILFDTFNIVFGTLFFFAMRIVLHCPEEQTTEEKRQGSNDPECRRQSDVVVVDVCVHKQSHHQCTDVGNDFEACKNRIFHDGVCGLVFILRAWQNCCPAQCV